MRNYFKSLTYFSGFSLLFWMVIFTLNISIPPLDLDRNKSSVILGDSHGRHGINPELLSRNTVSYCMSAEPLSITYFKLMNLNKELHIDTLFLVVGPHSLSNFQDFKLSDDKSMIGRYPQIIMRENLGMPFDTITAFHILTKELILYPRFLSKETGDFTELKSNNGIINNNVNSRIERHFKRGSSETEVSNMQLSYYKKIRSFCKQNKISLFTVATPVHPTYLDKIPSVHIAAYDSVMSKYYGHSTVDGLRLLYNDSLFYDADHLNVYGSKVFTAYLKDKIMGHGIEDFPKNRTGD